MTFNFIFSEDKIKMKTKSRSNSRITHKTIRRTRTKSRRTCSSPFIGEITNTGRRNPETPSFQCDVLHLSCDNPSERRHIMELAEEAKHQQQHFMEIYPWENECNEDIHVFVGLHKRNHDRTNSDKTNICAWATVKIDRVLNAMFFIEVSARRNVDGTSSDLYKGMGIELMKSAIQYATKRLHIDFVYLIPVNETVQQLYSQTLQMFDVPNTKYMALPVSHVIREEITAALQQKQHAATKREQEELNEMLEEMPTNVKKYLIHIQYQYDMSLDEMTNIVGELSMLDRPRLKDAKEIIKKLS